MCPQCRNDNQNTETIYLRSGINHNYVDSETSKDLLDDLKSCSFVEVNSIESFDVIL